MKRDIHLPRDDFRDVFRSEVNEIRREIKELRQTIARIEKRMALPEQRVIRVTDTCMTV